MFTRAAAAAIEENGSDIVQKGKGSRGFSFALKKKIIVTSESKPFLFLQLLL